MSGNKEKGNTKKDIKRKGTAGRKCQPLQTDRNTARKTFRKAVKVEEIKGKERENTRRLAPKTVSNQ